MIFGRRGTSQLRYSDSPTSSLPLTMNIVTTLPGLAEVFALERLFRAICSMLTNDYNKGMYKVKRMPEFEEWFDSLKDGMTRIRLAKRLDKVQRGLLGDAEPVGEGVYEMREFFGPGWQELDHDQES